MSTDSNDTFNESAGGKLREILLAISIVCLILAGITIIFKVEIFNLASGIAITSKIPWEHACTFLSVSVISGYISYRIAEGRKTKSEIFKAANHTERVDVNHMTVESVADALHAVFCALSDAISEYVNEGAVDKAVLRNLDRKIKLKLECDTLMAFLVTFLFQNKCESFGQDQATSDLILDRFHEKLFLSMTPGESLAFSKLLKQRYAEYYPVMRDDLRWLKTAGTILFRGVAESFLSKIAPDKSRSEQLVLFSLTFARLYSIWGEFVDKIAKYKID